ncbi:hypothetical protein Tco_0157231 [Tanacetum coccineum]
MPVELGSFDVIIGMDWLRRYHAMIVCDEKLVSSPTGIETVTFCGIEVATGENLGWTVISVQKLKSTMAKGCRIFVAQRYPSRRGGQVGKETDRRIRTIGRDFPEVFLRGLARSFIQLVERWNFRLDLIPEPLS